MLTSLTGNRVELAHFHLQRAIPRPEHQRQPDFLDKFDSSTLFYDLFRSHDGQHIIAIAPPPFGYEKQLKKARFTLNGEHTALKARHRSLSRLHEIWLKVSPEQDISSVDLELNGHKICLTIAPNNAPTFAGRKMLSTICKDTPIPWIIDWVKFHAVNHGADGLVLFENSDTPERAENIAKALEDAHLLAAFQVVHVPFQFGPIHFNGSKRDSDYLQSSLLALLRWKYLQQAKALLYCDIDELIATNDGSSIFDHVQKSMLGYLFIEGVWVETATTTDIKKLNDIEQRRHKHFQHTTSPPRRTHRKWVCVPSKIPMNLQWKIHAIRPEPKYTAFLHPVYTRWKSKLACAQLYHLHAINTGWKYQHDPIKLVDTNVHILDNPLHSAILLAFKD